MIKRFHALYIGQIELDNMRPAWYAGKQSPVSERAAQRGILDGPRCGSGDGRARLLRLLDRRAPFPAGRV